MSLKSRVPRAPSVLISGTGEAVSGFEEGIYFPVCCVVFDQGWSQCPLSVLTVSIVVVTELHLMQYKTERVGITFRSGQVFH